jgi:hypothetical protein
MERINDLRQPGSSRHCYDDGPMALRPELSPGLPLPDVRIFIYYCMNGLTGPVSTHRYGRSSQIFIRKRTHNNNEISLRNEGFDAKRS